MGRGSNSSHAKAHSGDISRLSESGKIQQLRKKVQFGIDQLNTAEHRGFRAITNNDGELDKAEFERLFASRKFDDMFDVKGMIGLYTGVVNNVVEGSKILASLQKLEVAEWDNPSAMDFVRALHEAGVFTRDQNTRIHRHYGISNDCRHASPTIATREIFDGFADLPYFRAVLKAMSDATDKL